MFITLEKARLKSCLSRRPPAGCAAHCFIKSGGEASTGIYFILFYFMIFFFGEKRIRLAGL